MNIASVIITIEIPWAKSLKDKRQVRRSLIDKVRQRFNVSIAEVDTQDEHRRLTLGAAAVSEQISHANEMLDEMLRFIENNTEAEITQISY